MTLPPLPEKYFGQFEWRDFKPVTLNEENYWIYLRGNMATFGKWSGFWGTIRLWSPLLNMICGWKYRHLRLGFVDAATGEELDVIQSCALKNQLRAPAGDVVAPQPPLTPFGADVNKARELLEAAYDELGDLGPLSHEASLQHLAKSICDAWRESAALARRRSGEPQ